MIRDTFRSLNRVFVSEFRPDDVVAGRLRRGARPVWQRLVGENLLLLEGNALVCGLISDVVTGVTLTKLNEANACVGVGDDTTAPAAEQTGLVASVNKLYKGMETGYPMWDTVLAALALDYRAIFLDTEAEFVWAEATLANGATDGDVNLGRLLFDVAIEKTAGRAWAVDYTVKFV